MSRFARRFAHYQVKEKLGQKPTSAVNSSRSSLSFQFPTTQALVIGAGIAGTVAAMALQRAARSEATIFVMAGRECYHCKQWIDEGDAHDCWTTTEAVLTADLSEDLREAWERLREELSELGDQRIYASGTCIMFARETVYCFVRPRRSFLEVSVFLARALKSPHIRRVEQRSKTKVANILKIIHRDAVEPPLTDWLREAYELEGATTVKKRKAHKAKRPKASAKFLS